LDTAKSETVEADLDRLIECRHGRRVAHEGKRLVEEMWAASERAYFARLDEERRQAWVEYHQGQATRHRPVLEALIAEHEEQAEKYRQPTKGLA
jgi:hypothetical protein